MDFTTMKVLVVDDEEDLAEIAAETFEMEDFQVDFRLDGKEGIKYFDENHVDVVISDNNMPKKKGMELLEALVAHEKPTPLFYLCTGDVDFSEEHLKEHGGTRLVHKPYDMFALVETVKTDLQEK
jgi:DNA-binding response OmpR family regulator